MEGHNPKKNTENRENSPLFPEMKTNQDINDYVEHLLQMLREKELMILNKKAEIESFTILLSFYREQFDMDNYSQNLQELQGFFPKFLKKIMISLKKM